MSDFTELEVFFCGRMSENPQKQQELNNVWSQQTVDSNTLTRDTDHVQLQHSVGAFSCHLFYRYFEFSVLNRLPLVMRTGNAWDLVSW